MRHGDIDWAMLRAAMTGLVLSTLVSVGVYVASQSFWRVMTDELARRHHHLKSAQRDYHRLDEEARIIKAYLPRYQALEAAGVIGQEDRLSWIEKLREAAVALKLPGLTYEIETRERFRSPIPIDEGKFKGFVSRMTLQLGLLHEADLLRLLQYLDQHVTGLYSVVRCTLGRIGDEFSSSAIEHNLSATCVLRWFTVKPGADA